jgi:hypothetical protein
MDGTGIDLPTYEVVETPDGQLMTVMATSRGGDFVAASTWRGDGIDSLLEDTDSIGWLMAASSGLSEGGLSDSIEEIDRITTDEMSPPNDSDIAAWNGLSDLPYNFDVDGSGDINPLDVLVLINAINEQDQGLQLSMAMSRGNGFLGSLDIDGDSQIGPLDALLLINELNRPDGQFSSVQESGREMNSIMAESPDIEGAIEGTRIADDTSDESFDWSMTLPAFDDSMLGQSRMMGSTLATIDESWIASSTGSDGLSEVAFGDDPLILINNEPLGPTTVLI